MKKTVLLLSVLWISISVFSQSEDIDFIDFKVNKVANVVTYPSQHDIFENVGNFTIETFYNQTDKIAVITIDDGATNYNLYFYDDELIYFSIPINSDDYVSISIYVKNQKVLTGYYLLGSNDLTEELSEEDIKGFNELITVYQEFYNYYYTNKYKPEILKE